MTQLSVNINKFATLRNARGGDNPNVVQIAKDCERFGAQGITVHPRPDERHITRQDVYDLKDVVTTEFNIEGYPDDRFMKIIEEVRPVQATLVPDPPNVLTSNAGWDTINNEKMLSEIISQLQSWGVRTSIFIEPENKLMDGAKKCGTDRVELYTEMYASSYHKDKIKAIEAYKTSSEHANHIGLGLNAGHDLDLKNLNYLKQQIPYLEEVSIGHALVCDALYYGLENTIQMYLRELDV
ncbi:pyridoxine 5'-phosphate synthase [Ekhidna lutea]|uniref:Pyridoxine 5'-phosphate synthase n=1 Tax=Ekhidna lutea TaxID=447679 RepID=A0A239F1B8_EKHLU|nr:pyridoxine 5'-phosphate synthase [Ekhidna lutea]SNS50726.1 pyridoxine 5'-phosphate synthase [Ekhidna lutea]